MPPDTVYLLTIVLCLALGFHVGVLSFEILRLWEDVEKWYKR